MEKAKETEKAKVVEMVKNKIPRWVLFLLIVLIVSTSFFGYQYYTLTRNPNEVAQEEVKKIVSAVSRLMVLPSDETPTLATVSDPELLRNQPFFLNAKKDDKVLIYTNAQKAILFRPSVSKIIEVAPINLGSNNNVARSRESTVKKVEEEKREN